MCLGFYYCCIFYTDSQRMLHRVPDYVEERTSDWVPKLKEKYLSFTSNTSQLPAKLSALS